MTFDPVQRHALHLQHVWSCSDIWHAVADDEIIDSTVLDVLALLDRHLLRKVGDEGTPWVLSVGDEIFRHRGLRWSTGHHCVFLRALFLRSPRMRNFAQILRLLRLKRCRLLLFAHLSSFAKLFIFRIGALSSPARTGGCPLFGPAVHFFWFVNDSK